MKLIISLFLSLLASNILLAQESIFDESILKGKEIVLLGEQTHGDGAAFDKKLSMVKELHEKGGFNLLTFESGMYDNFKAYQLYSESKEDINIFKQSVGWLYSDTQVFQELLEYIDTHQKLRILGFDSQESTLFEEYFLSDFKTLCKENNITISDETYIELEKTLVVHDLESYIGNKRDSTALYDRIQSIKSKIDLIPKDNLETKILIQTFKSVCSDMDFTLKSLQKEKSYIQNPRDRQMAKNLMFIKETFPNEKIIGWGASYHFSNRIMDFEYTEETEKYIEEIYSLTDSISSHNNVKLEEEIDQVKELNFALTMGKILKDKYEDKLFSIAFTSFEGRYLDFYHNKLFPILEPPSNSIEFDLKKQGFKNTLHILKSDKKKFYSSALGYLPLYADWHNVFDGIYYIEKMYPPKYLEYSSNGDEILEENSPTTISGTIVDFESKKHISYSDIYYNDSNISTVSNSIGQFSISNSKNPNSYLVFSAIGYITDSMQVKNLDFSNRILLNKSKDNIVLNEAVVVAKFKPLSPEEIVKRARNNIDFNYVQSPYNQSFFFKVKDYNSKDTVNYGEEAYILTFNKKGVNGSNRPEANFFGEIKNLRGNTDKYNKSKHNNGTGSLWVALNRDIILSKSNILYRTSSYDLTNGGTLNYQGRKVYRINFINNSPGSYSTGYGYPAPESSSGSIFIDTESFAVLKYEHCIQRASFESKKTKNIIKQEHKIVQSYKSVYGKYFINLLEINSMSKVYSPENKFLDYYLQSKRLVSHDIKTENIRVLKRPLIDLKKGFKKEENDIFWDNKKEDFKIETSNKEMCEN